MHGRHNLYFKLHFHDRMSFYRRPDAAVRPQVVHPCSKRLFNAAGYLTSSLKTMQEGGLLTGTRGLHSGNANICTALNRMKS